MCQINKQIQAICFLHLKHNYIIDAATWVLWRGLATALILYLLSLSSHTFHLLKVIVAAAIDR